MSRYSTNEFITIRKTKVLMTPRKMYKITKWFSQFTLIIISTSILIGVHCAHTDEFKKINSLKPIPLSIPITKKLNTDELDGIQLHNNVINSKDDYDTKINRRTLTDMDPSLASRNQMKTKQIDIIYQLQQAANGKLKKFDKQGITNGYVKRDILKLMDYIINLDGIQIIPGVWFERKTTVSSAPVKENVTARALNIFDTKALAPTDSRTLNFREIVLNRLRRFADTHTLSVSLPRVLQTGRVFLFKGLKKFMWPVFIGVQIAKTFLLAMFLPSIIGSIGKMVGKGLGSVSGFNHPSETVDDLEFKDNFMNTDQDQTKYTDYTPYNNQDSSVSATNFASQMYDAGAQNNVVSRFGDGQKATYVPSSMDTYYPKDAHNMITMGSKKDDFKIFHDIPASSMFLTNYDPFYSPLLSRLDSVFQQFGSGMNDEPCREKLVCQMYANPAKYAPYSNLVSAQLSRELSELKKPTTDNPDVLRFFKYMRAAKEGQDGVNCDTVHKECTKFSESEGPAMINTFNDINKLVQARKLSF